MKRSTLAMAAVITLIATNAFAQDFKGQLAARQGQMWVMALNLGALGDMAKGKTAYDADAAQRAADSLAGVAMIDQSSLWPEGSDDMSIDGTRAMAAMWDDGSKAGAMWGAYVEAANNMKAVAGQGADKLGPALGAIGGSCKSCHTEYRAPK
jgi:cytochrome c556